MLVPGGLVCALVFSAPTIIQPRFTAAAEPAAAAGSQSTVVVDRFVLAGDASRDTEEVIRRAVVRGLGNAGKRAIDPPANRPPGPCTDASCAAALATAAKADYVIGGRILDAQRNYELTFALHDGGDGRVLATRTASCPICSMPEVEAAAAKAVGELASEVKAQGEARLQITSCPSGATVYVDGALAGNTPFAETVAPGEHNIEVKSDGYVAQTRSTTVEAGSEAETLAFSLVAKGAPNPSRVPLGWAAVGLGGASLIAGIALLAIDDNPFKKHCEGDNLDDAGRCRFQYNTLGGGVTSLLVGAALAGGGAALLILDRKRRGPGPRARAQLRVGVHARGLTLSGRF